MGRVFFMGDPDRKMVAQGIAEGRHQAFDLARPTSGQNHQHRAVPRGRDRAVLRDLATSHPATESQLFSAEGELNRLVAAHTAAVE